MKTVTKPELPRVDTDVVVVGSGPVGSALGANLGSVAVRVVVLEARGAEDPPHPGTNLSNVRTMEHFRHWGTAESVRAANPLGPDVARDVHFVTRGNGHIITKFEGAMAFADRMPFSSAAPHFGPQASIEKGLRARLAALPGCQVRFSSTFEHFVQHDDHVEVTYRDADGVNQVLTCSYLVGADGGRSRVRQQLGLRLEGNPNLQHGAAWYIRSPAIKQLLDAQFGSSSMIWFANEDRTGIVLVPQDSFGEFQYFNSPVPDGFDGNDWGTVKHSLNEVLGAEVAIEPLEGNEIWVRSMVAPRFSDGRVFLAGESAHLVSPYGGFGMNTGIGDVANLGWKLTAAVHGWAGSALLESYDAERIPIVHWIREMTEESSEHAGPSFSEPGMEESGPEGDAIRREIGQRIIAEKQRELVSLGAQLGAAYRNSPVIVSDGTGPPPATFGEFTSSGSPGARAPHVWLDDDHSLFDEIALEGFTLLRIDPDADAWSLERAAQARGIPLHVVTPDHPELSAMYEGAMVLLRPDHHVAWRGDGPPSDPELVLDAISGAAPVRATSVATG